VNAGLAVTTMTDNKGSNGRSNFFHRMVDVIIWVPIILLAVFKFTFLDHLLVNLLAVFFSILGGNEIGKMFNAKEKPIDFLLYPFLGGLFPLLALITVYYPNLEIYFMPTITLAMLMIMARQTFVIDEFELNSAIKRITGMIFALFYPGFFLSYIIRIATINIDDSGSNTLYAFFLLLVMMNDSMAYFWGRAWGKKTRSQGFILVSPSKSLIGFVGGLLAAVGVAVIFYSFGSSADYFRSRTIFYAVFMGLMCGFATITGDLFESTIKRSAGVKDSGTFFKGRGGVLDVLDSLLFTAPIFYYFLHFA
jgi:phosphatidate cytidylyltransferase